MEDFVIGYMTLGTSDLKKAGEFYDKVCGELGMARFMANDHIIAWGGPGSGAGFGVALPHDGKPMTVGNGVMAAFTARTKRRSTASTSLCCRSAESAKALPGSAAKISMPGISAISTATSSTPS
jgi:hypothetical protein